MKMVDMKVQGLFNKAKGKLSRDKGNGIRFEKHQRKVTRRSTANSSYLQYQPINVGLCKTIGDL